MLQATKKERTNMESVLRATIEDFLTVAETARLLKVSEQSVRTYERAGKLKAVKTRGGMRLFRVSEVEKFLEARRA